MNSTLNLIKNPAAPLWSIAGLLVTALGMAIADDQKHKKAMAKIDSDREAFDKSHNQYRELQANSVEIDWLNYEIESAKLSCEASVPSEYHNGWFAGLDRLKSRVDSWGKTKAEVWS